jgi:hypothetical protein
MNDLISRQAAIEHLKKRLYETALNNDTEHPYYEEMADNRVSVWLGEVPTVDAVPVVRCKDCRWKEQEEPGMVYCPATVGGWVDEDWFCKGGERNEDERDNQ